ncbi:MAG: rcp1 2, partial [Segetibacter sp.]|nr:rcp1 2 [Segetibacter sp.]
NILIADDDADDVSMLVEALKNILPSCRCYIAAHGIACLNHVRTNVKLDLVFLDLNMPLKNGIDCLRDMYNERLLSHTPVVIYSTSLDLEQAEDAYKYGAQFYIVKPTSPKGLNKIIQRAITILGKPIEERVDKANFVLREEESRPAL